MWFGSVNRTLYIGAVARSISGRIRQANFALDPPFQTFLLIPLSLPLPISLSSQFLQSIAGLQCNKQKFRCLVTIARVSGVSLPSERPDLPTMNGSMVTHPAVG